MGKHRERVLKRRRRRETEKKRRTENKRKYEKELKNEEEERREDGTRTIQWADIERKVCEMVLYPHCDCVNSDSLRARNGWYCQAYATCSKSLGSSIRFH